MASKPFETYVSALDRELRPRQGSRPAPTWRSTSRTTITGGRCGPQCSRTEALRCLAGRSLSSMSAARRTTSTLSAARRVGAREPMPAFIYLWMRRSDCSRRSGPSRRSGTRVRGPGGRRWTCARGRSSMCVLRSSGRDLGKLLGYPLEAPGANPRRPITYSLQGWICFHRSRWADFGGVRVGVR